jgi:hypothetical protein
MEVILALPFMLIPFFFPLVGGLMARSFGRSFWVWFWISVPLPFVSCIILLCLPDKRRRSFS